MQNNKVAIMSWYTYRNYGTALQASALYYTIKNMGYSPDLICYPPKVSFAYKRSSPLFKRVYEKLKSSPVYTSEEREDKFNEYLSARITETAKCSSYPELYGLNSEYKAFVCGSDQIWSPLSYDENYFLSFVENSNKMIAYAPSFGVSELKNPIVEEKMSECILRFASLSARESNGAELIKNLTGREALVALDPVLLLNAEEWDCFANVSQTKKLRDKNYIICYFLGDSDRYMSYVKKLSEKTKMPYYIIPVLLRDKKNKFSVPFEVGPQEFVSLIKDAKYVCTDSFHGAAFAVNYNVPFSVFKRFSDDDPKNQNVRIFSLLKMLKLEGNLVEPKEYADMIDCDFSKVNFLLSEQRAISKEYLKSALRSATNSIDENECKRCAGITDLCCGCGACSSVCPVGAVRVSKNDEGFEQHFINDTKCVDCGICKSVCPMFDITALDIKYAKELYSVKSCSVGVLKASSSGGVGYELARLFNKNGYYVCGCVYDSSTDSAKHIVISPDEPEKLKMLQGSKYIQSVSSDAMKIICELAENHRIAFFGTPCQAAAVDKLLRKFDVRENAVLVDLICHGVPTYHLFKKYIEDVTKKHKIGYNPNVTFRNKEKGWTPRVISVSGNGNAYKKDENKDDFYAFFRHGLCNMAACYDCPYREKSSADLRIGDYWGQRFASDRQGVSMVIANTEAGNGFLYALKKDNLCIFDKQNLNEYRSIQYPYNHQKPYFREQLIVDLTDNRKSMHSLRKEYCSYYDNAEKLTLIFHELKKLLKRS